MNFSLSAISSWSSRIRKAAGGKCFKTSGKANATGVSFKSTTNNSRCISGIARWNTFAGTITRPLASCGSINDKGNSTRASSETDIGLPFNWNAGRFCRSDWSDSATLLASFVGAAGCLAGGAFSLGSTPGTSVNFGRISSHGALNLNGIREGAAGLGVAGTGRVGTDGPLEAGTFSEAGSPVPFGGR